MMNLNYVCFEKSSFMDTDEYLDARAMEILDTEEYYAQCEDLTNYGQYDLVMGE